MYFKEAGISNQPLKSALQTKRTCMFLTLISKLQFKAQRFGFLFLFLQGFSFSGVDLGKAPQRPCESIIKWQVEHRWCLLTSGSGDECLQQGFPLGADLNATLWLQLQVPGEQEPGLAPHGGELLAGPWLGGFGGRHRRKASRHGSALLGPGLTWRGGFASPGRRGAGVGVEALAKLWASFGCEGGAVERGRSWAAGNV